MDITIHPRLLKGKIQAIPSKSMAHRHLICAAFADRATEILCPETSGDIAATVQCLNALGARIQPRETGYLVEPVTVLPKTATLNCQDSGSTLRFLLPVAAALGIEAEFIMTNRLPQRPISALWDALEHKGCRLSWVGPNTLHCSGKLNAGTFQIPGNVSSQFISGLLFAMALIPGESRLEITGTLESRPYVDMTKEVLSLWGRNIQNWQIRGGQLFHSPGQISIEGDWSSAAFFLAANALGSDIQISGLDLESCQGDRAAAKYLTMLEEDCLISVEDVPDLVPILAVVAACRKGAAFENIQRLRLKESDRIASTLSLIHNLGGQAEATDRQLRVFGGGLTGGTVDSCQDHRIAMAAAIAATVCKKELTILGADSVQKSYPSFWAEYRRLGGSYEQFLR